MNIEPSVATSTSPQEPPRNGVVASAFESDQFENVTLHGPRAPQAENIMNPGDALTLNEPKSVSEADLESLEESKEKEAVLEDIQKTHTSMETPAAWGSDDLPPTSKKLEVDAENKPTTGGLACQRDASETEADCVKFDEDSQDVSTKDDDPASASSLQEATGGSAGKDCLKESPDDEGDDCDAKGGQKGNGDANNAPDTQGEGDDGEQSVEEEGGENKPHAVHHFANWGDPGCSFFERMTLFICHVYPHCLLSFLNTVTPTMLLYLEHVGEDPVLDQQMRDFLVNYKTYGHYKRRTGQ